MSPSRGFITLIDPTLRTHPMLAASLQAAWYWGDALLRAELEASIQALVRKTPDLLPVLKTTLRTYHPPAHTDLDGDHEIAGLLLTLWSLGDTPLRDVVAAMICGYGQRHPAFGADFCALARTALHDPRVVAATDTRAATAAQLHNLVAQLER
jgi:hypothetical protein